MKNGSLLAAAVVLAAVPVFAGPNGSVRGDYVEARTAEVFTGGCIMGSEAETMGRQAVLAWRIAEGRFKGVSLDGLAVVAAIAGDHNLGIRELGGAAPSSVKTAIMVDERATPAQRDGLVAMVKALSRGLADNVVEVKPVPITFLRDDSSFTVKAGAAELAVKTTVKHSVACGAMKWFTPFSEGAEAAIGLTEVQEFWGGSLGSKWRQVDRRSAFFGTFSY
jgi:hypothetical protein